MTSQLVFAQKNWHSTDAVSEGEGGFIVPSSFKFDVIFFIPLSQNKKREKVDG